MSNLSSHCFDLFCDPQKGSFSLHNSQTGDFILRDARMLITCRFLGQRHQFLAQDWGIIEELYETQINPHHGALQTILLRSSGSSGELGITLTFALAEKYPLFLWKVTLSNPTELPYEIERIELLRVGGQSRHGTFQVAPTDEPEYSFYSNGWQSWSYTGAYLAGKPMRTSRLGFLQEPMTLNPGTPRLCQPGYYTADFFGAVCDLHARKGLLAGFLSQRQHFGTLEAVLYDQPSLRLWANGDSARLEPGAQMETDWAFIHLFSLDAPDPLGEFIQAVAREHEIQKLKPIPAGWCSWYNYFNHVTPADVRSNLLTLSELRDVLPLDHFQIDDGYEAQVGDWFDFKPAFADGMAPLASEIKAAGFTPGLWLAPFILHPQARIVHQHPDWLLRDGKGRAVNCGFGWNALTRGLDLTVPEALDYAASVVGTAVHEWGYPYIKLDFLFAPAVKGRYSDPTRTRAQVLRAGMQALRKAAGEEAFLVGCGAPLGSALGLVDSMRASEDVSPEWYPQHFGIKFFFRNEPYMPSASNAIHNTLARSALHKRWWINDPDCLLVRPDTELTMPEVQSLASAVALSGGSLLISDDLTGLPAERRRIVEVLLPLIGARPQVIDLFDLEHPSRLRLDFDGPGGAWHVLTWLNWSDEPADWQFDPRDYHLEPGSCFARSFWDGEMISLAQGEAWPIPAVPVHGVKVIALRKRTPGAQAYLGSDLHISQGLELSGWQPSANGLELSLTLPRQVEGNIFLWLPLHPHRVLCEGKNINWSEVIPDIYKFSVHFRGQANIQLEY